MEQRQQVGVQPREERLRLGIAEADVELQHLRAVRGQHQPGVEHAPVGPALGGEARDGRLDDLAADPGEEPRPGAGRRAHAAHPSGVRAFVALEPPLVVLRRAADRRRLPVGEREHADLRPGEALFEHHFRPGLPQTPAEQAFRRRHRFVVTLREEDPLARRQPARLHHRPFAQLAGGDGQPGGLRIPDDRVPAGGDAVAGAEVLGERLGGFEERRVPARAEAGDPPFGEPVAEPGGERRFRADDDQVRPLARREGRDAARVRGGHRREPGQPPDPGVARGGDQLSEVGALRNRPGEGVFPTAPADEQHPHRRREEGGDRSADQRVRRRRFRARFRAAARLARNLSPGFM